jgi:hypothetical protein
MAEAIAALSLACNVFQVISFAHEVYNVTKEIEETGSSDSIALVSSLTLMRKLNGLSARNCWIREARPVTLQRSCPLTSSEEVAMDFCTIKNFGQLVLKFRARYMLSLIRTAEISALRNYYPKV